MPRLTRGLALRLTHPAAGHQVAGSLAGDDAVEPGWLTVAQVKELFELVRSEDPRWTSAALAERFAISEASAAALVQHTRLPAILVDGQGMGHAYW